MFWFIQRNTYEPQVETVQEEPLQTKASNIFFWVSKLNVTGDPTFPPPNRR